MKKKRKKKQLRISYSLKTFAVLDTSNYNWHIRELYPGIKKRNISANYQPKKKKNYQPTKASHHTSG